MRVRTLLFIGTASLTVAWFLGGPGSLESQTPSATALTGVVSSTEEGPMEGVMA